ncbi:MAG: hypothetical protein HY425_02525 [Candidatus Levybacteria bacterium]|nr:hypothetical protein [Candidatus Levybacteria bacterium]
MDTFNRKPDTIQPMTLIVALKSKHGVVLAGDKRNYLQNATLSYDDNAVKVVKLNEKTAIGGGGEGYDCKVVIDELVADSAIKNMDVEEVKELMFTKARVKQKEWVDKKENSYLIPFGVVQAPQFCFILVGLTKNNEPRIYTLSNSNLEPRLIPIEHCEIGICEVAKYIFSKKCKSNMILEQLAKLASFSIKETGSMSTGVSPSFDLIKIPASK